MRILHTTHELHYSETGSGDLMVEKHYGSEMEVMGRAYQLLHLGKADPNTIHTFTIRTEEFDWRTP